ncbi:MAG: FAD-dependent oxidoreductase [Planctomycetes bacterium]|nr:FAD-dependent oxidoreductase [Planctomycetota bacterium]
MTPTVKELDRAIPVADEVDVLVCGGGPAGFCAALAAARAGARTLLVEQCNCMGGIATAGGHNHLCLYTDWGGGRRVVGGIPFEMVRRVVAAGYGVYRGGQIDFELEGLKLALEQMAAEANLKLLYHTLFSDAIVDGGRIAGAYIQNKSGRQAILAGRVIDCTGDADVAASAGAPWEMGRPGDGAVQPCTLMFTIGGVDWPRVQAFRKGNYKLESVWAAAQAAGDMEPFQSQIMGWWWTPTRPDQVGVNFTHMVGCDPTSARSITDATIEGRRQAFHMIPVFRKYIPGMENAYLISTAALLGTRESRRILGEHVLTDDEIIARTAWDDSIAYGSFFIDVHNCTGPGMDGETYHPEPGFKYQIPYRCLVPRGIDNLLVAGRCVSVSHRALGSLRVMPQCAAMGEAAGAAAALSLEAGTTPRAVDVATLQDRLRTAGAILDDAGIEAAEAEDKAAATY